MAAAMRRSGLSVFLPFAAGYFLSYLYRSINAVITLAVSVAIFFIVPEHRETPADAGLGAQVAGLKQIFKDRFFWYVAPVAAVFSG